MNNKNKITLYVEVFIVSLIIPVTTFIMYNLYGKQFDTSLLTGVLLAILASMSILAVRSR